MKFETKRVRDLISEISMGPFGSNIKVECFVDDGIPVLNGSNLDGIALNEKSFRYVTKDKADSLGRANAHSGDVIITHRGTLGQIAFIPHDSKYERYVISQSQFRVRCNEKILPEYLVYYFHTKEGQYKLLSNASQVGVPALARATTTFQEIEIEVPSLETQHEIVKFLETIRKKIVTNGKLNDNLLKQAQMLYSKFFPYKVDDIIPDGWRIGTVAEIIEIHDSRRVPLSGQSRDKMKQRVYPYYGAASLMDYVDDYIFDGKYLLLGEDGTVIDDYGYPILQYVWGKFWVNNHAHILTGKNGFNIESLYMLFRHTSVRSIVTGAVQAKISQVNLQSIPVIIPPKEKLNEYNHLVEPLFALYRKNVEENRTLASIRDALLPKLMTGQISINSIKGLSH